MFANVITTQNKLSCITADEIRCLFICFLFLSSIVGNRSGTAQDLLGKLFGIILIWYVLGVSQIGELVFDATKPLWASLSYSKYLQISFNNLLCSLPKAFESSVKE